MQVPVLDQLKISLTLFLIFQSLTVSRAAEVFVEAESFSQRGGWKLDTQFIQSMGSPYLLAHGLGRKVEDATSQLEVPESAQYRVWVRTYDWVARWNASPSPGRFRLSIGGSELPVTFGTEGKAWVGKTAVSSN